MQKYQNSIQDLKGNAVAGASIAVYIFGTATLATIYSDNGVTVIAPGALLSDAEGEFAFYAANGRYNVQVVAAGLASQTTYDVLLFDPADTGISETTDPGDTGFWPDVTATTKIQRVRDRMFVNDGASFTGNKTGTQSGFVPTSTEGANWASRDSSMFVAQDNGLMAVTGLVSNANIDTAAGLPTESIGVSGFAIGNKANRSIWALYGDVQFTQGTYAYGLELAVKNLEGANRTSYPYTLTVGTYGIWLAGGGDSSYGGVPTNPCNTAIAIGKNSSTWNTGILFQATGITGTDGVTGTGNAISMARGHVVSWYNSSNQQCATIYSDATTFASRTGIQFVDNGLWFTKAGALSLQLDFSAGTANYAQISSSAAANPVTVQASGSDTNIDLRLLGKGTGRVQFGTHTGTADTAISGYIEIKDASGTVRKLAVIS